MFIFSKGYEIIGAWQEKSYTRYLQLPEVQKLTDGLIPDLNMGKLNVCLIANIKKLVTQQDLIIAQEFYPLLLA